MTNINAIVRHLTEDEEDDFELKDVAAPEGAGKATVKRVKAKRMKIVDMADYTFLISYLTPVAYLDKNSGRYYQTKKQWSPTTNSHIGDWQRIIWKSPEWQADPAHQEASEYGGTQHTYVGYPKFERVPQAQISSLFRKLMKSMDMDPRDKKRLYHLPSRMRSGEGGDYMSSHDKLHPTGQEGLPLPSSWATNPDAEHRPFFKDFEPEIPDFYDWDWQGGRREPRAP